MDIFKKMNSFNVEMYSKKVAEMDYAIKVVNDYLNLCYSYGMTAEEISDTIYYSSSFSAILLNDKLSAANVIKVAGSENKESWAKRLAEIAKVQSSLFEILPYVEKSFFIDFDLYEEGRYAWGEVAMSELTMNLIILKCIEWEDDQLNKLNLLEDWVWTWIWNSKMQDGKWMTSDKGRAV